MSCVCRLLHADRQQDAANGLDEALDVAVTRAVTDPLGAASTSPAPGRTGVSSPQAGAAQPPAQQLAKPEEVKECFVTPVSLSQQLCESAIWAVLNQLNVNIIRAIGVTPLHGAWIMSYAQS